MNTKTKNVIAGLIMVTLVLALTIVVVARPEPPELPRPGERVMTARGECDTVKVGEAMTMHCTDGSNWVVVSLDPQPEEEDVP